VCQIFADKIDEAIKMLIVLIQTLPDDDEAKNKLSSFIDMLQEEKEIKDG